MQADFVLHVSPIGPLLSPRQMMGARVQYQPFTQYQPAPTPQHKDVLHTGIVTATHTHPMYGVMVRIQPDANTLGIEAGWYSLDVHVMGWAYYAPAEVMEVTAA